MDLVCSGTSLVTNEDDEQVASGVDDVREATRTRQEGCACFRLKD